MMYRLFLTVFIAVLTLTSQVLAQIPEMNLKYANYMPEAWRVSEVDKLFAKKMLERTNGKVRIQLFHSQTLGSVGEMPKLVGSGAVDIGNFPAWAAISNFPLSTISSIPLLFQDTKTLGEFMKRVMQHPLMKEETRRNNVHPFLSTIALEPYRLIATKPLITLDDLKGVKVRTSGGGLLTDVMKNLGMTPITVQAPETYEAVQRKTLDAVCFNYASFAMLRLYEVAKHASNINFGPVGKYSTYMNLKLWDSWSQEMKDIFNQVEDETRAFAYADSDAYEAESIELLKSKGVTIHQFQDQDKLLGKAGDLIDAWVKTTSKYGKAEDVQVIGDFARQILKDMGIKY